MIIVHHLENSRSQRILWLLEELRFPYSVKRYERNKKTMLASPELRKVHPLGKSPILEDVDESGNSIVIVETGAIVEYLVEKSGGTLGAPAGREGQLRYRQFLHYAEGSLMPVLLVKLVLGRIPLLGRVAIKRFQPMIDTHTNYVERELAGRSWFAGRDFCAADIMMSFPLEVARTRAGIAQKTHPRIFQWLDAIHQRPAYQVALANGGPYAYA